MIITATGVYGNNETEFFEKLLREKITLFIDIRQRRGMRGKKYAFANSIYLQNRLEALNIKYIHIKELAPTNAVREAQKQYDLLNNQTKQNREYLGHKFIDLYNEQVLNNFCFQKLIDRYISDKVVFFCVEQKDSACHRSLIVNKLKEEYEIDGYYF